jgi:hypothetical protein
VTVTASGAGGILADIPVTAGAVYLLRPDIAAASPAHVLSVAERSDGRMARTSAVRLAGEDWFPAGTIVRPRTDNVRVHLYSDTGTKFSVRSVDLIALIEARATAEP